MSTRSLLGCVLTLMAIACADSGTPGGAAGAATQELIIAGGAVQFYAGETREFRVLDVSEPVEWEVSAGAGTLVVDGSTAVLYASTAGPHTIAARLVSDPSIEGVVDFQIFPLDFRGDHDAVIVPEGSTSRLLGRDVVVRDGALYVATTLCGQYSRFSKRPLAGGDPVFHEVSPTSWPPTAQEQVKSLAVDSAGRVYLYVDVPVSGIDCSQPASQGDYRSEVRRYLEIEGGGFEEDIVWDADAYHATLEVGADDTLFLMRRVGGGDADQVVNLSGEGQVLDSFGFEVSGAGHTVIDVSGLALGAAGTAGELYIASGDFNVAVDPGVERWVLDDVDQVYERAGFWRDAAYAASWGVDVDDGGRVYLALQETFGNNLARVRIFNGLLEPVHAYPPAASIQQIQRPTAMSVDRNGDLWFFDELESDSSPAARVGFADFEPGGPSTPASRILPPGVVQRAGFSQVFRFEAAPPNTTQITWQTNLGPHRPLTPLGDIIRFIGGATVGSGPLRATALDAGGNVLAEAEVTITLTQFMTHGFSVPFGTIGSDMVGSDGEMHDIAIHGDHVWLASNDGLSSPKVERFASDSFFFDQAEASFCIEQGTPPFCAFYTGWEPRANVAADEQYAYWFAPDPTSGEQVLYRASHSSASGDKDAFPVTPGYYFSGAVAAGAPPVGGADASLYAVEVLFPSAFLVRIDIQGGAMSIGDNSVVDFGPGSGPRYLTTRFVEDLQGNQEARIVAVWASGMVVEFATDGAPLSTLVLPYDDIRDAYMGPGDLLYLGTREGTGADERSTIRVFNIAAGDEATEIASVSDYQFATELNGLPAPRLVKIEALAVDDMGTILVADDVEWSQVAPSSDCGSAFLSSFLRIRPDGVVVDNPDAGCPDCPPNCP